MPLDESQDDPRLDDEDNFGSTPKYRHPKPDGDNGDNGRSTINRMKTMLDDAIGLAQADGEKQQELLARIADAVEKEPPPAPSPATLLLQDTKFLESICDRAMSLARDIGNGVVALRRLDLEHELALIGADKDYAMAKLEASVNAEDKLATAMTDAIASLTNMVKAGQEREARRLNGLIERIEKDPKVTAATIVASPFGISRISVTRTKDE